MEKPPKVTYAIWDRLYRLSIWFYQLSILIRNAQDKQQRAWTSLSIGQESHAKKIPEAKKNKFECNILNHSKLNPKYWSIISLNFSNMHWNLFNWMTISKWSRSWTWTSLIQNKEKIAISSILTIDSLLMTIIGRKFLST